MTHYSEDELAWHSLKPRSDIAAHLDECAECSAQYATLRRFDDALSSVGTWTEPRNLRDTEDTTRDQLREIAWRLANETAEAERSLGNLIANPLPFIWKDVSRKRGFRTAGAVQVLCVAANNACEGDPLHALNLADAAVAIAMSFNLSFFANLPFHARLANRFADAMLVIDDALVMCEAERDGSRDTSWIEPQIRTTYEQMNALMEAVSD